MKIYTVDDFKLENTTVDGLLKDRGLNYVEAADSALQKAMKDLSGIDSKDITVSFYDTYIELYQDGRLLSKQPLELDDFAKFE